MRRLTGSKKEGRNGKDGEEKGIVRVVYMPRKEYEKWFKRDEKGVYVGSEPYRRWREEELEREFARYKPVILNGRGRGRR